MFARASRSISLVLLLQVFFITPLQAADNADILLRQEIDRLEKERQERSREELRQTPVLPFLPATPELPETEKSEAAICFPVSHIAVEPKNILPAGIIRKATQAYEGRCLTTPDLAALQAQLNAQAMRAGLVTTRVVIPEQNLRAGVLHLQWWIGRVEAIQTDSLTAMELAMASPIKPGDILQLRALEQTIDNLNRLSSFKATADLLPGERAGSSIVAMKVTKENPFHLGMSWQGTSLVTEDANHAMRASLVVDSPLKMTDRLILGYNRHIADGDDKSAGGQSIDYDFPIANYRFSFQANQFESRQLLHSGVTLLDSRSRNRGGEFGLSRLLKRDERHRLTINANISQQLNDTTMNGITIGVSSYRLSGRSMGFNHAYVKAPWVVDSAISLTQGDIEKSAPVSPFAERYWKTNFSQRWQYYWQKNSASFEMQGQVASSGMAPATEFSLTANVPGFHASSLTAPKAVAALSHYAHSLPWQQWGLSNAQLRLGYAWAAAPSTQAKNKQEISSVVAELVLPWQVAVAKLQLARPLRAEGLVTDRHWQFDAGMNMQW